MLPLLLAVIVLSLPLPAVSDGLPGSGAVDTADGGDFLLTIVHINDHHSHLEADTQAKLEFNGKATRVEMGGFPRVVSKIRELSLQRPRVLKMHSGDAITGTLYYVFFKGKADAALMNSICFDTFELGNHEFDGSDAGLKDFLAALNSGDCETRVLAANVVPETGTPLAPRTPNDYLQPYALKEIDGERVGVIGIDIAGKTMNSSSPLPTTRFLNELETAQRYIDRLQQMGVNKIVLSTHQGYGTDVLMAPLLSGVDVIVGGDSHSLLGEFDSLGLNPEGPYPTQTRNKGGHLVCVVQAWSYSNLVGELNVTFDADGNVKACSGTPHLLLGDSFKRRDADGEYRELEGKARQEVLDTVANTPQISIQAQDPLAVKRLAVYTRQVQDLETQLVGKAREDLCFERIPGDGGSKICDASVTSAHGGDIQQLVIHAFRERSFESDIGIQNAGGVRIDIPKGDISYGEAYTLLPFGNTLVNLSMTGAEIVQALEQALDYALDPQGSDGSYPYAAGLRWKVDLTRPIGMRFSDIEVKAKGVTAWRPIDPDTYYTVVTNSYLAAGKDGYQAFGKVSEEGRAVDTYIDYTTAFLDYIEENAQGEIEKLPVSDYSTHSFVPR